jgi:hypothetical protein
VTNWRQIQARIRKARVGADAPAKLQSLFEKTRDAMVAFELARAYEKDNRGPDAIEWYTKSLERFRREDWKKKAVEAIVRLGGTPPVSLPALDLSASGMAPGGDSAAQTPREASAEPVASTIRPAVSGLPPQLFYSPTPEDSRWESVRGAGEVGGATALQDNGARSPEPTTTGEPAPASGATVPGKRRRRRGRRGGRGRHRPQGVTRAAASSSVPTATPQTKHPPLLERPPREEQPRSTEIRAAAPATPPAASAETGWVGPKTEALRARAGDPALVSQIAQLEMQLRRLIGCPPRALADADQAPAGPGVLILSDSDLTTHYYVVACPTLRIEMGRLGKSDRGARGRGQEASLRSRLAEHLGISESQVTRYLNQHCVARWLQLDDGAARLAHFAIAVLRPALND